MDQSISDYLYRMEKQLRWDVRSIVSQYPFFLTIARWRYPRKIDGELEFACARAISDDTDIVIEGFPRSGNTFAVTAFKVAQNEPVQLANHLHAPAQVNAAVRRGLPTVVLIRDPLDAAVSFIIQHGFSLTGRQVFEQYLRFYRAVEPVRDEIVVAPFEQVISDFGAVIERVNEQFDTAFDVFDHTEENEQHCFDIIERDSIRRHGGEVNKRGIARPTESRQETKEKLRRQLNVPELEPIRKEALAVYNRYIDTALTQPA